jgi:hypothetical protein
MSLMMMKTNPITPPPELRRQWLDNDHFPMVTGTHELLSITRDRLNSVIDQAAQWGADQELEACCEWITGQDWTWTSSQLRAARRPKPPSLKEQARVELDRLVALISTEGALAMAEPIRRALEALDD